MFFRKNKPDPWGPALELNRYFFSNVEKNLAEYRHEIQPQLLELGENRIEYNYFQGNKKWPTIYLVQGLGATRNFLFEGFLFFRRAGFNVLVHDRRGETRPIPLAEITIEKNLADMQAVISHCRLKDIHIISSSFGGILSLMMAEKHPGLVRSVTTIGSFLSFPWTVAHDVLLDLLRQIKIEKVPIRDLGPLAPPIRFIKERSMKLTDFVLEQYDSVPRESYYGFLDMLRTVQFEETAPAVDCRLLFLQGEKDDMVPMSCFESLKKHYPHAESRIISNSAHGPFLSQPEELYRTILTFYQGINSSFR